MLKTKSRLLSFLSHSWLAIPYLAFVILAGRIAFTRAFPLPYDEAYHFGAIKLYTHHLSPFLAGQPIGADYLGAIARDPSYLYHYLMSFPLHLISIFAQSQSGQIIALRTISIGLGLATLYLVVRLCYRFGLSRRLAYLTALALAITPAFYDIGGQINYDNLLIPLSLLVVLGLWQLADQLKAGRVKASLMIGVVSLMLLTSLVQYSFLPILAAGTVYLLVLILRGRRFKSLFSSFGRSFLSLSRLSQAALVILVIISTGLWLQRDGLNIWRYHTPVPQCDAVMSVGQCSQYGPWARNYQLRQQHLVHPEPVGFQMSFLRYIPYWLKTMYFKVWATAHIAPNAVVYQPVVVLMYGGAMVLVIGTVAVLSQLKALRRQLPLGLLVALSATYLIALLARNYADYHHLGLAVAVQGRYLLPFLALGYALVALGYVQAFRQLPSVRLQAAGWLTKAQATVLLKTGTARRHASKGLYTSIHASFTLLNALRLSHR